MTRPPDDDRTWGQRPAHEDPDEARDLALDLAEDRRELDAGDVGDEYVDDYPARGRQERQ